MPNRLTTAQSPLTPTAESFAAPAEVSSNHNLSNSGRVVAWGDNTSGQVTMAPPGSDFSGLEQSGEQARAIGMGAHIVSAKKLNEHVIQQIDSASSSFWKAKSTEKDPSGLGLMDRQRVKMWLRDLYREIDEVGV